MLKERREGAIEVTFSAGACDPLMSVQGQERRISAVRNISALPPRADVGADIVEPPLRAITGREQMQQTTRADEHLLNHLVGESEQLAVNGERLCGF